MNKETTISIISNAIGYELHAPGEPNEDGILSVTVTDDEEDFCRRAAERVYRQVIEGID